MTERPADPASHLYKRHRFPAEIISHAVWLAPLIGQVLEDARARGLLAFQSTAEAIDLYLSLLVGDLQPRRIIGREPQPARKVREKRAKLALGYLVHLLKLP